ncbi:MAG TPA: transcription termination factor NusA [Anaerolineales bacterium]|nr:transcription termination factor NusA [Anaerolineales bacterium]
MKNEFSLAFNEVLEDKQLPKEVVLEAIQAAMVSAYRRAVNASTAQHIESSIDAETGKVQIFAEKEVVESVQDSRTEVSLNEARRFNEDAAIGEMVIVETTPRNFGRVAAQTARQVIQQRIREAERDVQHEHFSKQAGEILSGVIQAINPQGVTLGLDMKAEGIMPRNQQIPGERFRVHDRIRSLLLEVKTSSRGPQIILSRAHRNFLRRLLENEVPEIYQGLVEVRSIAREPGQRSKVAVAALQPGVDPVGACVGLRGVRIQAIVRELNDEKIDVIEWNPDPALYIAKALSPARVSGVYLNEHAKGTKTATVVVPEDQLSLAIGRDGQNARLAAKLTSWRIDIKSLPEAATDALNKLRSEAKFAEMAQREAEVMAQVEVILGKKLEGRPVTPEEYQVLAQFVDRVEKTIISHRQIEKQAEEERQRVARSNIPAAAFEMPITDFEISDRVFAVISEVGYESVGDLMFQMQSDPDSILALNGMGPKGMKELQQALDDLTFPGEAEEGELEAEVEEAAEAEAEEAPALEAEEQPEAELAAGEPVEAVVEDEVAQVDEAVEAPVEAELDAAAEEAPVAEGEAETTAAPEGEAEEDGSLDEIFKLTPEALDFEVASEDDEFDEDAKSRKKKKKKKYTQVVYDPDKDVTIVKRKRKRSGENWNEWDEWDI